MFTYQSRTRIGAAIASFAILCAITSAAVPATAHSSPTQPVVADSTTGGDCGTISFGATTTDDAAIKVAASCLQQAYASCQAAQLAATWDTANEKIDRVISVTPGDGSCQIVENVTHTVKASNADSNDTYRCARITTDANGITVRGCGADGDVQIRLKP